MDQRVKQDYRSIVLRDKHLIVERHEREKIGGNRHAEVVGEQREKIGAMHLQVDQDLHEKVGQNWAAETGMEIHLKAGMKVVIEAGVQIHLKVGGNHIDISPAGITIQGTLVKINSGPSPGQGSGAKPIAPEEPDVSDDGSRRTKLA
jgi:type VI secretion system secreted protein VgrG